jgi:CheY-like chemotaxis protein
MKRVLDVGNCAPDHASITAFLKHRFDCEVVQADDAEDALAALQSSDFDLVLVNRKLDVDYSDGMEVIRKIKSEASLANIPVMLITNYPEHQESAMKIGAVRGFGKLELGKPETVSRLKPILG